MSTIVNHIQAGRIIHINPPIEFDCVVENKPLKAKVTAVEDYPIRFIYHISFSDGYDSAFYSYYGWFDRNEKVRKYVRAIKNDLNGFGGFTLGRKVYCFRLPVNNEIVNVWVVEHFEQDEIFTVRYNGEYRFHLFKANGIWKAECLTPRHKEEAIDKQLADSICRLIESN